MRRCRDAETQRRRKMQGCREMQGRRDTGCGEDAVDVERCRKDDSRQNARDAGDTVRDTDDMRGQR